MSRNDQNSAARYSTKALIIIALAAFAVGVGSQTLFDLSGSRNAASAVTLVRETPKDAYTYISPLIAVDVPLSEQPKEYATLKATFESTIGEQKKKGSIQLASVFFREFKNGQWIAIDPDEKYSPASLLKIPLMIAFFKMAETDPAILSRRIFYDGSFDLNTLEGIFAPSQPLKAGNSYTIEELIRRMVSFSDNNAVYLLSQNIDTGTENEVYTDLGLTVPPVTSDPNVDFMTIKDYASFFRVLYSSTYLTRNSSEKALLFLAQSDFSYGVSAGVPKDIPVAEKFGERTQYAPDGKTIAGQELHDCSIVYYPKNSYLLCVMTRGDSFSSDTRLIKAISQAAYSFVSTQRSD